MYKIILVKRAIKDLEKLNEDVKVRIKEKLKTFVNDPVGNSRKLSNPLIGSYRFRIGDYRVIFDIEKDKVIILRIGHRKDIYN